MPTYENQMLYREYLLMAMNGEKDIINILISVRDVIRSHIVYEPLLFLTFNAKNLVQALF